MPAKKYHPLSSFWLLIVPGIMVGIFLYAYRGGGWLPSKIRGTLERFW